MTPEVADGWRAVLALEHEAVWTCSLVGARFSQVRETAQEEWRSHQLARDRVLTLLSDADEPPVAARDGYDRPVPRTLRGARGLVADVEQRLLAASLQLVGVATGRDRRRALVVLTTASDAATRWGARAVAFPGLSDEQTPTD